MSAPRAQRYSPLTFGEQRAETVFNLFTLSATVSYALDIFGGERRWSRAWRPRSTCQRATEQATYLTLAANIVNTVIAKAAYRAEIEATSSSIELQKAAGGAGAKYRHRRGPCPIPPC